MEHQFITLLRNKRREAGITVDQLASKLNVSQPFITRVEKGVAPFPLAKLMDWSAAINAEPDLMTAEYLATKAREIFDKAGVRPLFKIVPYSAEVRYERSRN